MFRHFIYTRLSLSCCIVCLWVASLLHADIAVQWGTDFLVPGEETSLLLINTEGTPILPTKAPYADGASIQVRRGRALRSSAVPGGLVYVLPLTVKADRPGELKIPDIPVEINGKTVQVSVPSEPVVSTAQIRWYEKPFDYGALWYSPQSEPYVNENVKVALKLFLPEGSSIPYAPQLEKDGISADYLLPEGNTATSPVAVRLRGKTWAVTDLSGGVVALREGEVSLAGKVPITVMVTNSPGAGIVFSHSQMVDITLPRLRLKALPLPPNAPAEFENAVGRFILSAKTDARTLALNEPVAVELTVRGEGNLAMISCPVPDDAEHWKLYPPSTEKNTNDRGETVSVTFRQLMRPLAEVQAIPAFSLTYFDPVDSEYKKAETHPIALEWEATPSVGYDGGNIPVAEPPPAGTVPVAEMTDIYGIVPAESMQNRYTVPLWLLSVFYIPALVLACRLAYRVWKKRRAASAGRRLLERELRHIGCESDPVAFLKGAGAFIETHVSAENMTEELKAVLRKRDEEAFRPEGAGTLGSAERKNVMSCMRRALAKMTLTVVVLLLTGVESLAETMAEKAYAGGQYSEAVKMAQQIEPSEDVAYAQYIMGNAYYRLGEPGRAALAYARALAMYPNFAEARANLDFIWRKEGAILPDASIRNSYFAWLSFRQTKAVLIISGAALSFCLILLCLKRGRKHIGLTFAAVLSVVVFVGSAAGCFFYLHHADGLPEMIDPDRLCYAVNPVSLRNAADSAAAEVIKLPASTPVRVLAVRGSWVYAETFDHTRGWTQKRDLEAVGAQELPGFRYLLR